MRYPELGSAVASAALDGAALEAADSVAVRIAIAAGPLGCFAVETSGEIPVIVVVMVGVVADVDLAGSAAAWDVIESLLCLCCTS